MPEEVATAAGEIEVGEKVEHFNLVSCPRCGSDRVKRIARIGLLHQYIYPMFGRYPWRCTRCGATSVMKKRAQPRRRRRHSHDAEDNGTKSSPIATPGL